MGRSMMPGDEYDGVQYDTFNDGPGGEYRGRCRQCGKRDCACLPEPAAFTAALPPHRSPASHPRSGC